jgi:hypothetical protein
MCVNFKTCVKNKKGCLFTRKSKRSSFAVRDDARNSYCKDRAMPRHEKAGKRSRGATGKMLKPTPDATVLAHNLAPS